MTPPNGVSEGNSASAEPDTAPAAEVPAAAAPGESPSGSKPTDAATETSAGTSEAKGDQYWSRPVE
ncbi:hypothetical protein GCM10010436_80630 [Paractinoplanes durhamensis]